MCSQPLCYDHVQKVISVHNHWQYQRFQFAHQEEYAHQRNRDGWVYYLRVGAHIKIGFATSLNSRLRAYPPTSELLAAHPGTRDVERDMHRRFATYLAAGREYFHEAAPLTQHIAQVLEQFKQPRPLGLLGSKRDPVTVRFAQ